jgi:flagellar hook-length control protein FliK
MTDAVTAQNNMDVITGNGAAPVPKVSPRPVINQKDSQGFKVALSKSIDKQQAAPGDAIKSRAQDNGTASNWEAPGLQRVDHKQSVSLPSGKGLPLIEDEELNAQAKLLDIDVHALSGQPFNLISNIAGNVTNTQNEHADAVTVLDKPIPPPAVSGNTTEQILTLQNKLVAGNGLTSFTAVPQVTEHGNLSAQSSPLQNNALNALLPVAEASNIVTELKGEQQELLGIVKSVHKVDNNVVKNQGVQLISSNTGSTDQSQNNSSELFRAINQKSNISQAVQVSLQQAGVSSEQSGTVNSDLVMRQNELLKQALQMSTGLGTATNRQSLDTSDGVLSPVAQYFKQYISGKQSQELTTKGLLTKDQAKQPLLFKEIEPLAMQPTAIKTMSETSTPGTATVQLLSHPQHPGWSKELGQRMVWLVQSNVQQAQLQLNPRHLGPMEVQISVSQDQQVSITFTTNTAVVKEALDSALPRLRELFDEQGLDLNDVNVADRSQQHAEKQASSKGMKPHSDEGITASDNTADTSEMPQHGMVHLADGVIDYFA